MVAVNLRLSESGGEPEKGVTQDQISELVDTFYEQVRGDDLIGPIFDEHVRDWDHHLEKMKRFWSSAVLRTGTYSGRPMEAHRRLPGLERRHFDRWQSIFTRVTDDVVPDTAHVFQDLGRRMGASMIMRLLIDEDG
ncbi:MAG: group III truncated hemoglobin [Phycisphaera sp.]|nr:MAG: group III truncated hemoglobin [Phycisphaera sp.]